MAPLLHLAPGSVVREAAQSDVSASVEAEAFLLLVAGAVAGFGMLFSLGANDVANSIGVAVGSEAISLKGAVIIAAVMNFLGAILAGARVSSKVTHGVAPELGKDPSLVLNALAFLAVLIGSIAVIAAGTYFKLPLSSTHAIIGSLVGVGILLYGPLSISWDFVKDIVFAWFASPTLGFILSFTIRAVLDLAWLGPFATRVIVPSVAGATACGALSVVLFVGPDVIREKVPEKDVLLGIYAIVFLMVFLYVLLGDMSMEGELYHDRVLRIGQKRKRAPYYAKLSGRPQRQKIDPLEGEVGVHRDFTLNENAPIFRWLLLLTVPAVAFAHGSNDVSNGVGPFMGILAYYLNVNGAQTPPSQPIVLLVLAVGALGICGGVSLFGHLVIETIGRGGLTGATWTYASGFAAQAAAASSVLCATAFGLPVSTSHSIVGAVVATSFTLRRKTRVFSRAREAGHMVVDSAGTVLLDPSSRKSNVEEEEEEGVKLGMLWKVAIGAIGTPILAAATSISILIVFQNIAIGPILTPLVSLAFAGLVLMIMQAFAEEPQEAPVPQAAAPARGNYSAMT